MFYTRLKQLCDARGIAISAVVKSITSSSGMIDNWKKGGSPRAEIVAKIADVLNTSTDYLLERTIDPSPIRSSANLSATERALIADFQKLDSHKQMLALTIIEAIQNFENEYKSVHSASPKDEETRQCGHYMKRKSEGKAAAGLPITAVPEGEDGPVVLIPQKYTGENYFVVEAQGDSMINAGISSGDFCVFQSDAHVDDGAITFVQIDGCIDQPSGTIKRLYRHKNSIELRSENDAFEPMFFNPKDVHVSGVLVYVADANDAL